MKPNYCLEQLLTDEDVKNNSFLHDLNVLLEHADKKGIKLTAKKNVSPKEIKIINELFAKKEILGMVIGDKEYKFRGEIESHYFSRLRQLAKIEKLVHPKFNKIITSKNNYSNYCNLSPAEQYIKMFNTIILNVNYSSEYYDEEEVTTNFLNGYLFLILWILREVSDNDQKNLYISLDVFSKEFKKYIDLKKIWSLISKEKEDYIFINRFIQDYFEKVLDIFDIVELKWANSYTLMGWKLTSFGKQFIDKCLKQQRELERYSDGAIEDDIKLFNHDKEYCYYKGMEFLEFNFVDIALLWLYQSILLDENYVAAYIGLASLYGCIGDVKTQRENIKKAFQLTVYKLPFLGKEVSWGIIENRQYLRALENIASLYNIDQNIEEAEEIYKLILRLNPNDNQGIRYYLAGLYEGLFIEDIEIMFKEGDQKQDWSKLEDLVKRQSMLHNFFE